MKQRFVSILLVLSMIFTLLPIQAFGVDTTAKPVDTANPFEDVMPESWYYDAVQYVYQNDIFKGTSDTSFTPEGTMTRGMFVTVLGRMAGVKPANYKGASGFSDVADTAYYAPYVKWAARFGITSGTGNGMFSPDGLINRQQLATFFVRCFEAFDVDYSTAANITAVPEDLDSVAPWAQDAVLKLWKEGLMVGGDGKNFSPADSATRAQTATLCMRMDETITVWYSEPGVIGRNKAEKPKEEVTFHGSNTYSVRFYDGDHLIASLSTRKNTPLGRVPSTEQTSKANAIFAGWYTDPVFTTPFYADNPVTGNISVYARYEEMDGSALTVTSFAQVDLEPDAIFTVVGSGDISTIVLTPKDGSAPLKLRVTGSGPYTVTAVGGFKPGASYELTLPEGLSFVGSNGETLPDTVRTASFTIAKEAVANLKMSDGIHYVQHNDPSTLAAGNAVTIANATEGDLICFYKTTNPEDRDYKQSAYMDDPETWFKAGSVSGETVTLAELDDDDSAKMYEVPDNFPVTMNGVGSLPNGEGGTLTLIDNDNDGYALDIEFYKNMVETKRDATLEYASTKVSVGDFVSIYVSSDGIEDENDVYFGKVTAYDATSGMITYIKSSAEEIEASMDLYIQPVLDGDDLLSEEAKAEIERTVYKQVQESGFAEEAAFMLAELATETDGFRNMDGIPATFSGRSLAAYSARSAQPRNLGKSFELSDDIKLSVEIVTSGDQLHFHDKGSVQLGIGIDAGFEVDVEDGGKVAIDLSAAFQQELAIGITANGELVKKKIMFIPIPIGVKVGASLDLLSYTGFKVDAHAYTVAEEDKDLWEQLQEVAKDPRKLADVLPDGDKFAKVKEGLETVGDVFDKIDEVKETIEQVRDDAEKLKSYTEDLAMLWEMVGTMEASDLPTQEQWEQMGETLGKTNVSKDLMDMLDLTTETSLSTDSYADSLESLLEKYCEMLSQETDWVKLVEEQLCRAEINIMGFVIYFQADFIVRADMNIAMGASLQYQVGKRYNFWLKIGLFKPEVGSSTMDLIDEQFTFMYYVMGKLGLKMGIEGTAGFAIGSASVARVGLYIELGPYVKLYGFFIYQYERTRDANTTVWISNEQMAGALYLDFGLYLIVGVEAAALGDLFEVSYDFVDEEFPLLTAGNKLYPYKFNYEPEEGELVLVEDYDSNSENGITMKLPEDYIAVSYCDLVQGTLGAKSYGYDAYNYSFSNPNFSIEDGILSVNVPENTRYMECDMTITYKYGKLAFSQWDMQVTVPLVWTNLSTEELDQYYTASVRVGNDTDGYNTVWTKRVRKNQEFTLPTEAELKALIGYDDAMYASLSYYAAGQTHTITGNTSYDAVATYKDYTITVNGIENADGTSRSQSFSTHYGNTFDFSALADTGTNIAGDADNAKYTKFIGVSTEAKITANGQTQTIDLTQPITGRVAEALRSGTVTATASYGDDSVLVTYVFSGCTNYVSAVDEIETHTERIRKGAASTFDVAGFANDRGMMVTNMTPERTPISSATTYYVECKEIKGDSYTITFDSRGGNSVDSAQRIAGSWLQGTLPEPDRHGYTFAGWCTDEDATVDFNDLLMPSEDITLYAKWEPVTVSVTLNVNGGNNWTGDESPVTVYYEGTYGALPTPERDGHHFLGWFTEVENGTEVTADTVVENAEAHTLYAHWRALLTIPEVVFDFGCVETYTYATNTTRTPTYTFTPEAGASYSEDDFTFRYKVQGESEYIDGLPLHGGTYDVLVTREADEYYARFEKLYTAVVTINYISFDVNMCWYNVEIEEKVGTGTSYDMSYRITWSDGSTNTGTMPFDKDWNKREAAKAGVVPTKIEAWKDGLLSRKVSLELDIYDILGNRKRIYDDTSSLVTSDYSKTVSCDISALPASDGNINVDSVSKIQINLATYGVNSTPLSGVNYTTDCPAAEWKNGKLLIDGSKLNPGNTNVAIMSNGKTLTVFTVTRNEVN